MSGLAGATQNITAVAGFAYGVIGADLHVFSDGTPLYLLEQHQSPAVPDRTWLRQLPSRMLNARAQVVAFTGRQQEFRNLNEWLTSEPRLAVRWLSAPGGQGKTRLAANLAETAVQQRWKVVTAIHGVGAVRSSPASQDLRLDGHQGVLLIVDYADRWTSSALTFLLRNSLLYQLLPTRVLLLSRTATSWPALRAALADPQLHADTSLQPLTPIADSDGARQQMFTAARDSFAALYDLPDPAVVGAPTSLEHPDFGLTLTLHVAALVGVDAHATGGRPPSDPHNLTSYLLDREHLHWERLYEQRIRGLDYQTPPSVMARTAFTAVLTGPISDLDAHMLLDKMEHELPAPRVITDHTRCYPATDPAQPTALEPLHPDRLAEDYLAITLAGTIEQPPHAWAAVRLQQTLAQAMADQPPANLIARSVTFLTAAAARWPSLGPAHLYPLLRERPQIALAAGGAALATLAAIPHVDLAVLEAIEPLLPQDRHVDLDIATAAITTTLTRHRLAATSDPAEHTRLHLNLARRLANAGQREQALSVAEEATAGYRRLIEVDPAANLPDLAMSLSNLGGFLAALGRREEALAPVREAISIYRGLVEVNSAAHLPDLAMSLSNLSGILTELGRQGEALGPVGEAVALQRQLADINRATHLPGLATAMINLGTSLSGLGRWEEALDPVEEAVALQCQLAEANPTTHLPDLATALNSLSGLLFKLGRRAEALDIVEEAVAIRRRLAEVNPTAYLPDLAASLTTLGTSLSWLGRQEEALEPAEEAATIHRQLAESRPAAHLPDLAASLTTLGTSLSRLGRWEEALSTVEEAVAIRRRLAEANPTAHLPDLAKSLNNLAIYLVELGGRHEALATAEEATAIYHQLAKARPAAYLSELAGSLDNLGNHLAEVGRKEQALHRVQEGLAIRRRLAEVNPTAHLPDLAASLHNLGGLLFELGRQEEALGTAEEAVAIYRQLGEANPATYLPDVAMSLSNLGTYLSTLGRRDEALDAVKEAVAMRRQLAEAKPAAHLHSLAISLAKLGLRMSEMGRRDEALDTTEEAVSIYRQLGEANPTAHLPNLAWSLCAYAQVCVNTRHNLSQALTSVLEAIRLYEGLVMELPQAFESPLLAAHRTLADILDGLGCPDEAAEMRQQLAPPSLDRRPKQG
ncbi:tetratricopeptide repeat protein [Micromonospora sp. NPDC047793]|uniref:tetratricopeptide repeat protein n=1 Tax=Micromonospora sp. NPDC047793 TaxID=3154342 RepID=UPI0033E7AF2F